MNNLPVGPELDAEVFTAMGYIYCEYGEKRDGSWRSPSGEVAFVRCTTAPVSTRDEMAVLWCLPWLRKRCLWSSEMLFRDASEPLAGKPKYWATAYLDYIDHLDDDSGWSVEAGGATLAEAICRLVLAVAEARITNKEPKDG